MKSKENKKVKKNNSKSNANKKLNSKFKKKAIILLILFILLIAIVLGLIILNKKLAKPEIKLIGENEIILNLDEEYEEKGAVSTICGNKIETEISGEVDLSVPGEYTITYTAKNELSKKEEKITRKIIVKDNIAPNIELNGEERVEIYEGVKYEEKGAKASDNIDGDLTSEIETRGEVDNSKAGEYEIEYIVSDKAGNNTSIKRKIIVKTRPVIKSTAGLPVLMYHFFYDKNTGSGQDNNWIEISDFEAQIKYLTENDFYFPTWDEVEQYIDGNLNLPSKSVVITVDDGDASFFDLAVPIIQKYNAKATTFVITGWYGWRADNKQSNISYQSHSDQMHEGSGGKGVMLSWGHDKVVKDLKTSSQILGGATVFCYPFGHYNSVTKQELKDADYKLAFTTEGGRVHRGSDKYALPRVRISRGITLNSFMNMVK